MTTTKFLMGDVSLMEVCMLVMTSTQDAGTTRTFFRFSHDNRFVPVAICKLYAQTRVTPNCRLDVSFAVTIVSASYPALLSVRSFCIPRPWCYAYRKASLTSLPLVPSQSTPFSLFLIQSDPNWPSSLQSTPQPNPNTCSSDPTSSRRTTRS